MSTFQRIMFAVRLTADLGAGSSLQPPPTTGDMSEGPTTASCSQRAECNQVQLFMDFMLLTTPVSRGEVFGDDPLALLVPDIAVAPIMDRHDSIR